VAATEQRFWHVSLPESELGSFFKRTGDLTVNSTWVGNDDEVYLFSGAWEERERQGSAKVKPHVVKTRMFEFVRQPSAFKA
jgi:hypothetical protein